MRIFGKRSELFGRLYRVLLVVRTRTIHDRAQRIRLALESNVGCAEELTVCFEDLRPVEHLRCGHKSGGHFE